MKHTLSTAIDGYLAYRRNQYADNTVRNDEQTLRHFLAVVGNIAPSSIDVKHVDLYFTVMAGRLAPATINARNAYLRGFFKWCRQTRLLRPDQDPMVGRRWLKDVPKKRVRIPASQFDHVLDSARHPADRVIVAIGLYLFLRQSEICTLKVGDVRLDEGLIDVAVWKTSLRDEMPICAELDVELRRWLTWYSARVDVKPEHYLVPAKRPPKLTGVARGDQVDPESAVLVPDKQMRKAIDPVRRVLEASGVYVPGEVAHTLRRSGSRALYDRLSTEGHDDAIRKVQAMLHHTQMKMTEHYIGIEIDAKRRNDLLRGKPMFPKAGNVTPLRRAEGE